MSTLKTNNIQHVDRSDPSIIINTDGSVNIAGTMTYEDVTNVDAVGIITGRDNVDAQKQVLVGTGVSVKAGGLNVTAGITTVQALQGTSGTFSGGLDITSNVDISDSIRHKDDTNTKIRFPSSDTFTIETAGTERFRITSTGKVGISSDAPTSLLTVGGGPNAARSSHPTAIISPTSGNASLMLRGNSPTIDFDSTGGGNAQVCTDNAALIVSAGTFEDTTLNAGEMVRIDSNGRVLIGTTTEGHSNADDLTIATSANTGITIRSGTSNGGNIFFSDATSGTGEYAGMISYDHNDNIMTFATNDGTERLRIDSSGTLKLNQADSLIHTNSNSSRLRLFGGSNESVSNGAALTLHGVSHSSGNYADLAAATGGHIQFRVGTSEKLRIDSNGNVVLGHTAANGKLQINSGSSNAVGDSTNPALQIGGEANYRLAAYTTSEAGIIANKNGDDGIQFHSKLGNSDQSGLGEAQRITSRGYRQIAYSHYRGNFTDNTVKTLMTFNTPGNGMYNHFELLITFVDNQYRQAVGTARYAVSVTDAAGGPGVSYHLHQYFKDVGSNNGSWSWTIAITSGGALQSTIAETSNGDAAGTVYVHIIDAICSHNGTMAAITA